MLSQRGECMGALIELGGGAARYVKTRPISSNRFRVLRLDIYVGNNTFKSKGSLGQHKIWRHTDDKKYECDLCSFTCSIKKDLVKHVKKVHNKTCVIEAMRKFQGKKAN